MTIASFSSIIEEDLPNIPGCNFSLIELEAIDNRSILSCNYKPIIGLSDSTTSTGKGIKIAVIDCASPEVLNCSKVQEVNSLHGSFELQSKSHACHVAGIIKNIAPDSQTEIVNLTGALIEEHNQLEVEELIAQAIKQCAHNHVDFINLSMHLDALPGEDIIHPAIEVAIEEAVNQKVGILCSAGNLGSFIYPRSIEFIQRMDGWLRFVIATDYGDREFKANYSNNLSSEKFRNYCIAAPGSNIRMRDEKGNPASCGFIYKWEGTSAAAPMVTAAAALIKAEYPLLSSKEVLDTLCATARTSRLYSETLTYVNFIKQDAFYRNIMARGLSSCIETYKASLKLRYTQRLDETMLDWKNFGCGVLNVENALNALKEKEKASQES